MAKDTAEFNVSGKPDTADLKGDHKKDSPGTIGKGKVAAFESGRRREIAKKESARGKK